MEPLTIAEGTPHAITVLDVRGDFPWAKSSQWRAPGPPEAIFVHHTAGGRRCRTMRDEADAMTDMARTAPYGLPYNFLFFPTGSQRCYYLNDLDHAWPHTLDHNGGTAICAWGNYQQAGASPRMVQRMRRLIRALCSMWGMDIPVLAHRHCSPTACPGDWLYGELARRHTFDLGERWLRGEW